MEKKILYDKYLCYNFDPLRICRLSLNKTSKMQIVSSSAAAALQRLFNKLKSVSKSNKVSYTNWMKPISTLDIKNAFLGQLVLVFFLRQLFHQNFFIHRTVARRACTCSPPSIAGVQGPSLTKRHPLLDEIITN